MKKLSSLLLFALALVLVAGAAQAEVKNVIVFISDGWGQASIDACAYWNGERQAYEMDPQWTGFGMTNYMICEGGEYPPYGGDGFVGIWGYEPADAWADWYYMQNYATDSAAAATAMSTGQKSYKGSIGMGQGDGPGMREPLYHIFERAEEMGKSTGTVTSVQVSHATPAAFIAHNESRNNYAEIFAEQLGSDMEVLMGCGHPNYDVNGQWDAGDPEVPGDWKYVGGYGMWNEMVAGTSGWTFIDEKADFMGLADGSWVADRVVGIAQAASTLQHDRGGDSQPYAGTYNTDLPPYHDPQNTNVPTLACMTAGALKVLEQNSDGFALMVEGGAIDWAGHARLLGRSIEEQDDFNAAVAQAMQWVQENSNWEETLIIVTGDHETGFLWGPDVNDADPGTWFQPVQDNGPGMMPGFYFYSEPSPGGSAGHTNQAIPFYAKGAGSEMFADYVRGSDPVVGDYIDNVDVALLIFDLLQGSVGTEPIEEIVETSVPQAVALHNNYPNPFNPMTNIQFELPGEHNVRLQVVDLSGRLVKVLANETFGAGNHSLLWDGTNSAGQRCASGAYFYQIITETDIAMGKMTLVK